MSATDWPKDASEAFAWKLHGLWTEEQFEAYQSALGQGSARRFQHYKQRYPEWGRWVERKCAQNPDWCDEHGEPHVYRTPTADWTPPHETTALEWVIAAIAVAVIAVLAALIWGYFDLPGQGGGRL